VKEGKERRKRAFSTFSPSPRPTNKKEKKKARSRHRLRHVLDVIRPRPCEEKEKGKKKKGPKTVSSVLLYPERGRGVRKGGGKKKKNRAWPGLLRPYSREQSQISSPTKKKRFRRAGGDTLPLSISNLSGRPSRRGGKKKKEKSWLVGLEPGTQLDFA